MKRCAAALFVLIVLLSGCGGQSGAVSRTPELVPDRDLELLVPRVDEIDAIMGTVMSPQPAEDHMADNRNLVTNLNCLGVWHVGEAAIYGKQEQSGWSAVRSQDLRAPDSEGWTVRVVQAVVAYPSAEAARDFFSESADRWAQCTGHTVNITLNGTHLPTWRSGELDRTDTRLAIGVARGAGEQYRSCQRVLAVQSNVVIDVEACRPGTSVIDQGARIAALIASKTPTT